jgi:uncharacterized protein YkwD
MLVAALAAVLAAGATGTDAKAERGFAPAGPPAKTYAPNAAASGRPPAPVDPLRARIVAEAAAVARKLGRKPPTPDRRLDWAMTDLARNIRGEELPALEVLQFLTAHYGLVEAPPRIVLSHTSLAGADNIPERVRDELTEMSRGPAMGRIGVGIDRTPDAVYVALALQATPIELTAPIARKLPGGGHAKISARVASGYRDPAVVITSPDGSVRGGAAAVVGGVAHGDLRCGKDGAYQVEITAVEAHGAEVLANFPVYCGATPPAQTPGRAGMSQGVVLKAEDAERQMLALVNRDRKRAGLPPVVADATLAGIARAHSRDMADKDFVGHVSPRTGGAVDRVRRAGLSPGLVLENVGRAYSTEQAEGGFLSSPGHRGNILHPDARKLGVGIVVGPPVGGVTPMLVTQLFTN